MRSSLYYNFRFLVSLGVAVVHFDAVVKGAPGWTMIPTIIALLVWHIKATNAEVGR